MQRLWNRNHVGLAALAAAVMLPAAQAATDTTTFNVTATIQPACDVQATALSFGNYSAASGTPLDGSSTIDVFCTAGTPYAVSLDVGTGGGSFATRTLANGGDTLNFNLYTNGARTTIWGDGTASTSTLSGNGSGLTVAIPLTVYGRVPIGQDEVPGTYSSTIVATVTY